MNKTYKIGDSVHALDLPTAIYTVVGYDGEDALLVTWGWVNGSVASQMFIDGSFDQSIPVNEVALYERVQKESA